ncbi:MAG: hypothetical protein H7175_27130 [Burkholderiales bacterium]|nr:hypothetical protein [Anaerolineae bacterium]
MFFLLIQITLLMLISVSLQPRQPHFPLVESTELLPYDLVTTLSNDAHYIQDFSGGVVINTETNQPLRITFDHVSSTAGWSFDNTQLAFMNGSRTCTSPNDIGNLILFQTSTESITLFCHPLSNPYLAWSPFNETILSIGGQSLLDVTTGAFTNFTSTSVLDPNTVRTFVGFGRYLWDPTTQLPAAELVLSRQVNIDDELITSSIIEACTLPDRDQCVPFVDTLSSANVDVFDYLSHENWLLWGGHTTASGLPYALGPYAYEDRADTIIYLTDMLTNATQELYRFSSANMDTVGVGSLNWSPDAEVVALTLRNKVRDAELADLSVIGDDPIYSAGTLLLHLNWIERP